MVTTFSDEFKAANRTIPSITHQEWIKRFRDEYSHLETQAMDMINSRFNFNKIEGRGRKNKTRQPRALNFVANVANALFGVATQRQIEDIHAKINDFATLTEADKTVLNVHTEILNETVRDVHNINLMVQRLDAAIKSLTNISIAHVSTNAQMSSLIISNQLINQMEWTLNQLQNDYLILTLGLNSFLDANFPSPHIISDKVFEKLLKVAATKGNGLILPTESSNVALYRSLSPIILSSYEPNRALFYLCIPLLGDDSQTFDLYDVNPIPIHIPGTDRFLKYESEYRYLAVSSDRRKFMELDFVNECKTHGHLMVCSPDKPVFQAAANHCQFNIFTHKDGTMCNKKVIRRFTPVFIKIEGGYVYATDTKLTLHINCKHKRYSVVTDYAGYLQVDDSCDINSNTLSIPTHTNIKTHVIEIDILNHNISLIPTAFLVNVSHTISQLKDVLNMTLPEEPIDLHAVENRLKLLAVHKTHSRWDSKPLIIGYVGLALTIVAIVIFGILYIRLRFIRGTIALPAMLAQSLFFRGNNRSPDNRTRRISLNTAENVFEKLCTTQE